MKHADLVCPHTRVPLQPVSASAVPGLRKIVTTHGEPGYGMGDGDSFLALPDGGAYPVADGFPVLLYPEKLVPPESAETVDLRDPRYAEAYEEMAHYNRIGDSRSAEMAPHVVARLMGGLTAETPPESYPQPAHHWIDSRHDGLAQLDAYTYLAPLQGARYMQLGGSGSHAVKALLAGASEATLLTPMVGEARQGRALARHFGVEDRFRAVLGIGEELPFADGSFDAIYSGGCIHHMRTELAFGELHRVLRSRGRFAAVDPWATPQHRIGTRIFGKRERGVYCRPITHERLAPLSVFGRRTVTHHGPFLRYVFIALEKAGLRLSVPTMLRIGAAEDALARATGALERFGGSMVIAGERE